MDEVITEFTDVENIIIGGDLNGYVGNKNQELERVNCDWGFGERNEAGEKKFGTYRSIYDSAILNTSNVVRTPVDC